eukprot:7792347-Lingulodinium_polyedra.AAC.1
MESWAQRPPERVKRPRAAASAAGAARAVTSGAIEQLVADTARLALSTATQVRRLSADVVRTVSIPESSALAAMLRPLAEAERTYEDKETPT